MHARQALCRALWEVPENEFSEFLLPAVSATRGKCDSHYPSDRVLKLFLSVSTPFCKPGSCRLILATIIVTPPPPFSLTSCSANNRGGFITKRRIPKFIVKVCLRVLLLEVLENFQETHMHKSHQFVLQKCDVVCYGKAHVKTHTGGSTTVGSDVQACSLQDKELPDRTQALSQEALKECRCLGALSSLHCYSFI